MTEQEPELSIQELGLNDPEPPGALNVTVPVGDWPVTVAVTVVEPPIVTDDGVSVTVVEVVTLFTVSVAVSELGILLLSPP